MSDKITIFTATISSNKAIRSNTQRVEMILNSKKIEFETVDVAACDENKQKMREIANNDKAVPLQLAKGDQYLGDYAAFDEAVESDELMTFLKM